MPFVWRLQTTRSEKIALTGVFLTGSCVIAASIARLTQLHQVSNPDFMCKSLTLLQYSMLLLHSLPLFFWECLTQGAAGAFSNSVIWCSIEPSVAVISACLPTLRPVAEFILPKQFRTRSYRQTSESRSRSQQPGTAMMNLSSKSKRGADTDSDPKSDYWAPADSDGSRMHANSEAIAVGGRGYRKFDNKSAESHDIRVDTDIEVSESARSIV